MRVCGDTDIVHPCSEELLALGEILTFLQHFLDKTCGTIISRLYFRIVCRRNTHTLLHLALFIHHSHSYSKPLSKAAVIFQTLKILAVYTMLTTTS